VQRIFNCDKIQNDIVTLDKVLNSLVHGSPFCVIIYTIYKLSKNVQVFIGPPSIVASGIKQRKVKSKAGVTIVPERLQSRFNHDYHYHYYHHSDSVCHG